VTASSVLSRRHALRSFDEAAHHLDGQILNILQTELLHYSWEIEIDGRFVGSRHGFESDFEGNMTDGCGAGCATGDAGIEISPSDTN
jgi:hypothetical protein